MQDFTTTIHWGVQKMTGERVRPVGRHIQYLVTDLPKGVSDRVRFYFRQLVALGKFHNATVHISYGELGPKLWLHSMHTWEVAESWGRYFDLKANGGNPWHDLENFVGCKTISARPSGEEWAALFDDGSSCVNIAHSIKGDEGLYRMIERTKAEIRVSSWVRSAARDFLARYDVKGPYASCHVRRCDRLGGTEGRTSLSAISSTVAKHTDFHTWIFYTYTEEGYIQKLRAALAPLGLKLLFEDEVVLNSRFPKDNYFTYVLGKYLSSRAGLILETDHFGPGTAPVELRPGDVHDGGVFLSREGGFSSREEAYMVTKEEYEAACDNRTRGWPRLLPRPDSGA